MLNNIVILIVVIDQGSNARSPLAAGLGSLPLSFTIEFSPKYLEVIDMVTSLSM